MTSVAPGTLPTSIPSEEKRAANIDSTRRIPRLRWSIGVLLGVGVLIDYFDRINLSVAAPQLKLEFGLTDGELGWLFQRLLLVLRAAADSDRHDSRSLWMPSGQCGGRVVNGEDQRSDPEPAIQGRDWRRIHHSPLFWVGVVLCLTAIMIYVLSDDLSWRPHAR